MENLKIESSEIPTWVKESKIKELLGQSLEQLWQEAWGKVQREDKKNFEQSLHQAFELLKKEDDCFGSTISTQGLGGYRLVLMPNGPFESGKDAIYLKFNEENQLTHYCVGKDPTICSVPEKYKIILSKKPINQDKFGLDEELEYPRLQKQILEITAEAKLIQGTVEQEFQALQLVNFNKWYNNNIVNSLLVAKWFSLTKEERPKYFAVSTNGYALQEKILLFYEQLLNQSQTSENVEAVFFTSMGLTGKKDSQALATPHFISLVLTKDFLLIADPYGTEVTKEKLKIFSKLNEKYPSLKILFSTNKFQEDGVSCGPIATELTTHWMSTEQLKNLSKEVSPKTTINQQNLHSITLPENCIPQSLKTTQINKECIIKIRNSHLEQIKKYDHIKDEIKNLYYQLNATYFPYYVNSIVSQASPDEFLEKLEICKLALEKKATKEEGITEEDLKEVDALFDSPSEFLRHLQLTFRLTKAKKTDIYNALENLLNKGKNYWVEEEKINNLEAKCLKYPHTLMSDDLTLVHSTKKLFVIAEKNLSKDNYNNFNTRYSSFLVEHTKKKKEIKYALGLMPENLESLDTNKIYLKFDVNNKKKIVSYSFISPSGIEIKNQRIKDGLILEKEYNEENLNLGISTLDYDKLANIIDEQELILSFKKIAETLFTEDDEEDYENISDDDIKSDEDENENDDEEEEDEDFSDNSKEEEKSEEKEELKNDKKPTVSKSTSPEIPFENQFSSSPNLSSKETNITNVPVDSTLNKEEVTTEHQIKKTINEHQIIETKNEPIVKSASESTTKLLQAIQPFITLEKDNLSEEEWKQLQAIVTTKIPSFQTTSFTLVSATELGENLTPVINNALLEEEKSSPIIFAIYYAIASAMVKVAKAKETTSQQEEKKFLVDNLLTLDTLYEQLLKTNQLDDLALINQKDKGSGAGSELCLARISENWWDIDNIFYALQLILAQKNFEHMQLIADQYLAIYVGETNYIFDKNKYDQNKNIFLVPLHFGQHWGVAFAYYKDTQQEKPSHVIVIEPKGEIETNIAYAKKRLASFFGINADSILANRAQDRQQTDQENHHCGPLVIFNIEKFAPLSSILDHQSELNQYFEAPNRLLEQRKELAKIRVNDLLLKLNEYKEFKIAAKSPTLTKEENKKSLVELAKLYMLLATVDTRLSVTVNTEIGTGTYWETAGLKEKAFELFGNKKNIVNIKEELLATQSHIFEVIGLYGKIVFDQTKEQLEQWRKEILELQNLKLSLVKQVVEQKNQLESDSSMTEFLKQQIDQCLKSLNEAIERTNKNVSLETKDSIFQEQKLIQDSSQDKTLIPKHSLGKNIQPLPPTETETTTSNPLLWQTSSLTEEILKEIKERTNKLRQPTLFEIRAKIGELGANLQSFKLTAEKLAQLNEQTVAYPITKAQEEFWSFKECTAAKLKNYYQLFISGTNAKLEDQLAAHAELKILSKQEKDNAQQQNNQQEKMDSIWGSWVTAFSRLLDVRKKLLLSSLAKEVNVAFLLKSSSLSEDLTARLKNYDNLLKSITTKEPQQSQEVPTKEHLTLRIEFIKTIWPKLSKDSINFIKENLSTIPLAEMVKIVHLADLEIAQEESILFTQPIPMDDESIAITAADKQPVTVSKETLLKQAKQELLPPLSSSPLDSSTEISDTNVPLPLSNELQQNLIDYDQHLKQLVIPQSPENLPVGSKSDQSEPQQISEKFLNQLRLAFLQEIWPLTEDNQNFYHVIEGILAKNDSLLETIETIHLAPQKVNYYWLLADQFHSSVVAVVTAETTDDAHQALDQLEKLTTEFGLDLEQSEFWQAFSKIANTKSETEQSPFFSEEGKEDTYKDLTGFLNVLKEKLNSLIQKEKETNKSLEQLEKRAEQLPPIRNLVEETGSSFLSETQEEKVKEIKRLQELIRKQKEQSRRLTTLVEQTKTPKQSQSSVGESSETNSPETGIVNTNTGSTLQTPIIPVELIIEINPPPTIPVFEISSTGTEQPYTPVGGSTSLEFSEEELRQFEQSKQKLTARKELRKQQEKQYKEELKRLQETLQAQELSEKEIAEGAHKLYQAASKLWRASKIEEITTAVDNYYDIFPTLSLSQQNSSFWSTFKELANKSGISRFKESEHDQWTQETLHTVLVNSVTSKIANAIYQRGYAESINPKHNEGTTNLINAINYCISKDNALKMSITESSKTGFTELFKTSFVGHFNNLTTKNNYNYANASITEPNDILKRIKHHRLAKEYHALATAVVNAYETTTGDVVAKTKKMVEAFENLQTFQIEQKETLEQLGFWQEFTKIANTKIEGKFGPFALQNDSWQNAEDFPDALNTLLATDLLNKALLPIYTDPLAKDALDKIKEITIALMGVNKNCLQKIRDALAENNYQNIKHLPNYEQSFTLADKAADTLSGLIGNVKNYHTQCSEHIEKLKKIITENTPEQLFVETQSLPENAMQIVKDFFSNIVGSEASKVAFFKDCWAKEPEKNQAISLDACDTGDKIIKVFQNYLDQAKENYRREKIEQARKIKLEEAKKTIDNAEKLQIRTDVLLRIIEQHLHNFTASDLISIENKISQAAQLIQQITSNLKDSIKPALVITQTFGSTLLDKHEEQKKQILQLQESIRQKKQKLEDLTNRIELVTHQLSQAIQQINDANNLENVIKAINDFDTLTPLSTGSAFADKHQVGKKKTELMTSLCNNSIIKLLLFQNIENPTCKNIEAFKQEAAKFIAQKISAILELSEPPSLKTIANAILEITQKITDKTILTTIIEKIAPQIGARLLTICKTDDLETVNNFIELFTEKVNNPELSLVITRSINLSIQQKTNEVSWLTKEIANLADLPTQLTEYRKNPLYKKALSTVEKVKDQQESIAQQLQKIEHSLSQEQTIAQINILAKELKEIQQKVKRQESNWGNIKNNPNTAFKQIISKHDDNFLKTLNLQTQKITQLLETLRQKKENKATKLVEEVDKNQKKIAELLQQATETLKDTTTEDKEEKKLISVKKDIDEATKLHQHISENLSTEIQPAFALTKTKNISFLTQQGNEFILTNHSTHFIANHRQQNLKLAALSLYQAACALLKEPNITTIQDRAKSFYKLLSVFEKEITTEEFWNTFNTIATNNADHYSTLAGLKNISGNLPTNKKSTLEKTVSEAIAKDLADVIYTDCNQFNKDGRFNSCINTLAEYAKLDTSIPDTFLVIFKQYITEKGNLGYLISNQITEPKLIWEKFKEQREQVTHAVKLIEEIHNNQQEIAKCLQKIETALNLQQPDLITAQANLKKVNELYRTIESSKGVINAAIKRLKSEDLKNFAMLKSEEIFANHHKETAQKIATIEKAFAKAAAKDLVAVITKIETSLRQNSSQKDKSILVKTIKEYHQKIITSPISELVAQSTSQSTFWIEFNTQFGGTQDQKINLENIQQLTDFIINKVANKLAKQAHTYCKYPFSFQIEATQLIGQLSSCAEVNEKYSTQFVTAFNSEITRKNFGYLKSVSNLKDISSQINECEQKWVEKINAIHKLLLEAKNDSKSSNDIQLLQKKALEQLAEVLNPNLTYQYGDKSYLFKENWDKITDNVMILPSHDLTQNGITKAFTDYFETLLKKVKKATLRENPTGERPQQIQKDLPKQPSQSDLFGSSNLDGEQNFFGSSSSFGSEKNNNPPTFNFDDFNPLSKEFSIIEEPKNKLNDGMIPSSELLTENVNLYVNEEEQQKKEKAQEFLIKIQSTQKKIDQTLEYITEQLENPYQLENTKQLLQKVTEAINGIKNAEPKVRQACADCYEENLDNAHTTEFYKSIAQLYTKQCEERDALSKTLENRQYLATVLKRLDDYSEISYKKVNILGSSSSSTQEYITALDEKIYYPGHHSKSLTSPYGNITPPQQKPAALSRAQMLETINKLRPIVQQYGAKAQLLDLERIKQNLESHISSIQSSIKKSLKKTSNDLENKQEEITTRQKEISSFPPIDSSSLINDPETVFEQAKKTALKLQEVDDLIEEVENEIKTITEVIILEEHKLKTAEEKDTDFLEHLKARRIALRERHATLVKQRQQLQELAVPYILWNLYPIADQWFTKAITSNVPPTVEPDFVGTTDTATIELHLPQMVNVTPERSFSHYIPVPPNACICLADKPVDKNEHPDLVLKKKPELSYPYNTVHTLGKPPRPVKVSLHPPLFKSVNADGKPVPEHFKYIVLMWQAFNAVLQALVSGSSTATLSDDGTPNGQLYTKMNHFVYKLMNAKLKAEEKPTVEVRLKNSNAPSLSKTELDQCNKAMKLFEQQLNGIPGSKSPDSKLNKQLDDVINAYTYNRAAWDHEKQMQREKKEKQQEKKREETNKSSGDNLEHERQSLKTPKHNHLS